MNSLQRCTWAASDAAMQLYHDIEWGKPVHNDLIHFEFLLLESAQAGLSWQTILKRREMYREAFVGFDPQKVALFTDGDVEKLMTDSGIVRHRKKILSAISNAKAFLRVQEEYGSFDTYLWKWVNNSVIDHKLITESDIPSVIPEAVAMSLDMKKRGFSFFGPVICYAYMQSEGLVNDHIVSCFAYR